jgi:hypothetical protein
LGVVATPGKMGWLATTYGGGSATPVAVSFFWVFFLLFIKNDVAPKNSSATPRVMVTWYSVKKSNKMLTEVLSELFCKLYVQFVIFLKT